ncbi:MAG: transketolase [Polyangiaceae bacterium]|nr:transketolase [Polyangiaceae bacterium]
MSDFDTAVSTVQFLSADAVESAGCGHPGTPMALAGIATELFLKQLRHNPDDPSWPNRDRFVLSCGHASMLIYSMLHLSGYALSHDDIKNFRQLDSKTPGHPEYGHTAGVETTTGPLGQGVGNAVGMALASKLMGERVNGDKTLIDYRVFCIASDGDLMEGVASEAASIAGHLGLGNLIVIWDDNKITIDGTTEISFGEDVAARFEAYGWHIQKVDGHNPDQVHEALEVAKTETDKPSLIVARTHIAIGAPNLQDTSKAHGAALGADEIAATKKAAGWPLEPAFHVPDEVYSLYKKRKEELQGDYKAWMSGVASLSGEQADAWMKFNDRSAPEGLLDQLSAVIPADTKGATRGHSNAIQQKAAELVPQLVGGSADLACSVKTTLKGAGDIGKGAFAGRNMHYGIREHGMGSINNGLALSGFIPFSSTFLIFSDYMRPTIRLAAMMKQQALYIFSHDSVFLGEDGPTHQPVEQLWSLRLIPGLDVIRPADAVETAAAWTHALERQDGPTALSLSRHNLPPIQRSADFSPADILKGAYVVQHADNADFVLIGTGSELHIAVEAAELVRAKGKSVRIVSAPCVDAFLRLPAAEQNAILGSGRRVSVEAGATLGWRRIVGLDGLCVGVDDFGMSAPAAQIAERLGLTAVAVAEKILAS